jgi:predicted dehydrogenase
MMRIGIIGCGFIGAKRARSMPEGCERAVFCDSTADRAAALAREYPGSEHSSDWRKVVERPDISIVVVATTHDMLAEITTAAAWNGKHVLVEKPCARNAAELDEVIKASRETGVHVHAGFNHRFHPALQKARKLFDTGQLGSLMFIRGRYGHGGRLGYDKEWRSVPAVSGGGEAIDQGVHLIDLSRWFAGEFPHVQGHVGTYFWNMPVEDNCFLLLRTERNQIAFLHASWTEWKNLFSFEIYGTLGKLDILGLGGSYGVERLAYYQMTSEMGPPETVIYEYPKRDESWELEFKEFLEDIRSGRPTSPGLTDAQAALKIVEKLYEAKT